MTGSMPLLHRSSTTCSTIVRRVEALGSFLDTEDGRSLLAGAKRAANILAAEEKKGTAVADAVDAASYFVAWRVPEARHVLIVARERVLRVALTRSRRALPEPLRPGTQRHQPGVRPAEGPGLAVRHFLP